MREVARIPIEEAEEEERAERREASSCAAAAASADNMPPVVSTNYWSWNDALKLRNLFKYLRRELVGPPMCAFGCFWRTGRKGLRKETEAQEPTVQAGRNAQTNNTA
jgi:hypothetical protein